MVDKAELSSVRVPDGGGPFVLRWAPTAGAQVYVVCRARLPLEPAHEGPLRAGGLDLMLERWVVPADTTAVADQGAGDMPHRSVLARLPGGQLAPVAELAATPVGDGSPGGVSGVDVVRAPVDSWDAGLRVGTPADLRTNQPSVSAPAAARPRSAQTAVSEPGRASSGPRKPALFVERGIQIREPRVLGTGAPSAPLPRSPLAAWESQVRPRQAAASRLPDLRGVSERMAAETSADTSGEAEELTPRWAVIAAPTLLRDIPAARGALRVLRGYLKVGLIGGKDRASVERWAERVGVPLDGLWALPGDAEHLPRTLGCRAGEIVLFCEPGDSAPRNVRSVEVEPEGFPAAVDTLIDEL